MLFSMHLAKIIFAECAILCTRQCRRHSAYLGFPVVLLLGRLRAKGPARVFCHTVLHVADQCPIRTGWCIQFDCNSLSEYESEEDLAETACRVISNSLSEFESDEDLAETACSGPSIHK